MRTTKQRNNFPKKKTFFAKNFSKFPKIENFYFNTKKQNILIYKSFSFPNRQFLLFCKSKKFSTFLDFLQKRVFVINEKRKQTKQKEQPAKVHT